MLLKMRFKTVSWRCFRPFGPLVVTLAAVLLPAAVWADEIGDAQDRFFRSSIAAEQALEEGLAKASPDARPALGRALGEVRATRERTKKELIGARTSTEGKVRALQAVDEGTQTHLRVLEGVRDKVPPEARPGIERAMDVSRRGHDTALGAVGDSGRPGAGPPSGVTEGSSRAPGRAPGGVRGRPAPGQGGPPASFPAGSSGISGGPPVGRPGR